MWLFRRKGSRYWFAGWRDPRSDKAVTRSTKTTDQKLATQRGKQYEREHDLAPGLPAYALKTALTALMEEKRRNKRSAATLEITACKCGHLLRVYGDRRDVTTLTLEESKGYVDQRRSEGAHDHTISKELGNLLQALRLAHAATPPRFERDPSTLWPKAMLEGAYVPCDDFWTTDQYRTAQAHAVVSRKDHVTMYCHTGIRFSELYKLEAKHVDPIHRRIWVEGTKNKPSKRWVPLDAEAYAVACRRAELYPHGRLFPDFWGRSRLVQDMQKVAKRGGVPALSANDFRRTFATWCGEAGVDESVCEKWMGHTSGKMIRRVYQQLTERRASAQGAKLSSFTASSDGSSGHSALRVLPGANHAAKTQ